MKRFNEVGRRLPCTLMCLAIIPAIALAASDEATLQVGHKQFTFGICGAFWGYNDALAAGSYSPTGVGGGKTVAALADTNSCGSTPINGELALDGAAADPGQAWLTSVTCNGVTKSAASAMYSYYPAPYDEAIWVWPTGFGFTAIPVGTNLSCTITHK